MATATQSPSLIISSTRDAYDALRWPVIPTDTRSRHAKHLATVITWIRGQDEFSPSTNRRRTDWGATNCDPYSISPKHEAVLYQFRRSWGSKYGAQVRKSYYLATWSKSAKNHVTETEVSPAKARAAVRAFPDDPAGAVEYLLGVRPKPKPKPKPLAEIRGFKLVRVRHMPTDAGGFEYYVSYYDGMTTYVLGAATEETARKDHEGGLYMYLSQELCEPANIATRVDTTDRLAILEVVGEGKRIRYDRVGKYAVSRLTPLRVVRYLD